jgi:hypothetical protein
VLVDDVPIQRYAHAGRWYVEAVKGREYAIRLTNPYGVRVGVALSVDGLNTIDARETTAAEARKWVLGPYETVTISGWQTTRAEARRFEFTTEARSYGQALGRTKNLGVISAAFFKERGSGGREASSRSQTLGQGSADASPSAAAAPALAEKRAEAEYAATGMGRRTGHAVTQVRIDLEDTASDTVNIRYEFRDGLVRLACATPASLHCRQDPAQDVDLVLVEQSAVEQTTQPGLQVALAVTVAKANVVEHQREVLVEALHLGAGGQRCGVCCARILVTQREPDFVGDNLHRHCDIE